MTYKTYAKVGIHSLSRVLDGMAQANAPAETQVAAVKKTGTDDAPVNTPKTNSNAPATGYATGVRNDANPVRAGAKQKPNDELVETPETLRFSAEKCDSLRRDAKPGGNAPEGTEQGRKSSKKTRLSQTGGVNSGVAVHDPALAELFRAWDKLPEPVRVSILAIVRSQVSAGGGK